VGFNPADQIIGNARVEKAVFAPDYIDLPGHKFLSISCSFLKIVVYLGKLI